MNKQRLVILIIAALGILGILMPWFTVPFAGTFSGVDVNGWFVVVLYIIPAVLALMGDRTKPLDTRSLYGVIIPSLLCSAVGILHVVNFYRTIGNVEDLISQPIDPLAEIVDTTPSIGFGIYIIILAGIAITASAFLFKSKPEE